MIKEINDILIDAGATDAQIKWGDNLPALSWEKEKRMNKLEIDLKNVIVDMTALKGVEEALKRLEGI